MLTKINDNEIHCRLVTQDTSILSRVLTFKTQETRDLMFEALTEVSNPMALSTLIEALKSYMEV